jgi:hypothetical protein
MNKKFLWIVAILVLMIAACTPDAPLPTPEPAAGPTRTPRPAFTAINACDVVSEREMLKPMGEPMTIIEEIKPGQVPTDYSINTHCLYAGSDPASQSRLKLQILQPLPGLEVAEIDVIIERFQAGMESAGVTKYETLPELSPAAFWLPETQTMTVFMEDGTGVSVSLEPENENARSIALQVVEKALDHLGY